MTEPCDFTNDPLNKEQTICPKQHDCVRRYDHDCLYVAYLIGKNGEREEWGPTERELMEGYKRC